MFASALFADKLTDYNQYRLPLRLNRAYSELKWRTFLDYRQVFTMQVNQKRYSMF